jgi:hypothetical protein
MLYLENESVKFSRGQPKTNHILQIKLNTGARFSSGLPITSYILYYQLT